MDSQDLRFESEFLSDKDVEDELDSLVVTVANAVEHDESRTSVVDPYRMQQISYTYKLMKYMLKGVKASVTYKLHEPYQSMGSVSVTGSNFGFKNISWFMRAVELASNFEVYPKTDGTVCMTFTFHGLTKPIE